MPSVTVTKAIRPVDLMASDQPGHDILQALRVLGSEGASEARKAGADADAELRPSLSLTLTLHWE